MKRSRAVKRAAGRGAATINVHLIILVLVALLPTITFALVLVFRLNAKEREVFERGTRDTVRALRAAVDAELGAAISSLEALADSKHLEGADLRSFHDEAAAGRLTRTGWVSISLASPDGDPLLNVLGPYGVPLPPLADRETIRKVVETRRPVIGNLTPGSLTAARQVPLRVPVIRGGQVRYILTARVNPTTVHGVLEAQRIPPEWTGAVLDGNGVVVASTRAADQFVGRPGALVMRSSAAAPPEGWIKGDTLDGIPGYIAYSRSRFSGWTVSLAVPATDVDGPLQRSLWGVAAAGLVFIAAGVVAAAVIGTRIARPLGALAHAADALARRDPPAMPRSPVVEVDAVASAIDQAARERRAAEEEIRFLAEASGVLVSSLDYETTLEAVARLAVPRLADWSGVHVLDADGSIRCLVVAHGDPVKEHLGRQLLDRYPARPGGRRGVPQVLQTGEPILQPEFPPDFFGRVAGRADLDTIRSFGLRSLMIVPLTARGRTFGTMTFATAESERRYTAADLRIARSLAHRAAIAVDNAKLYAEAERRRREADVVAELARSINASLEADIVLQAVVRAARDLCDADFTRIALRDSESEAMFYRYTEGTRYEGYAQLLIDPGKGVTAWIMQTGRALRTESVTGDDRAEPQHTWLVEAEGTVSALILPIRVGARVEGLIYCGRRQRRPFSASEEDIGMRLATHAGTALRNAQLYAGEQRARAEAEALNRLKDEFLATLSHELRTPLNAMLGWVSMLKTGALDPATTARGLDTIERNTRLQAQLIEDLLDVSRIVAGKLHLDVRPLELGDVIRAAVEAVRPAATAKDLRLDVVVEAPPILVSGDPARLQQVVWNLLSNAVKFTPARGDVSVHVRRRDGRAVIEVRDTGAGIGSEFLPHVFDRFRQADASTTRRYGGLGLGLTIVRELVEVHGGTVRAESPGEGRGSTFVVELPLIQPPRDAPRSGVPLLAPVSLLRGVKVLVVDDDPDTREVLEMGLERQEAEVLTAGSVEEALSVLARDLPDVLVTDIAMPGEDGYALLRRVRSSDRLELRRLPAVALTAHARGEDRARAQAEGFEAYEPKPVDPVGFAETVARVVRQGRLTD